MAMRPRGGGTAASNRSRAAGVRQVFEDFVPNSEWQQNDESHILIIDLPGFTKDQISVLIEDNNIIRVRGERLVAGNKWSQFLEVFQFPDNCEMNSMHAKHQGGSLAITVPKKNVDTDIIALQKPREALSPKTTSIDTIPQKGPDKVLPKVSLPIKTNPPTDEKSKVPQKKSDDQSGRKNITPLRNAEIIVPQAAERKESSELKERHIASERQENVPKMTVDKERKNLEKSEELPEVETAKKMKIDKDGAAGTSEDKEFKGKQTIHSGAADYGAFKMGNYKKAMKGLTELNEERQLLVNLGVAVLVIVALSAYATYNFASGKAKK